MRPEDLQSFSHISFDLFDTLLLRRLLKPKDLFALQGSIAPLPQHDFAPLRIACELELRKKTDFKKEVTLDAIYDELARHSGLSPEDKERLKTLELELEAAHITVNAEAVALLEGLRTHGKQILFLSDIYLPVTFIEALLKRENLIREGDRLFVSSETGQMKSTGELYQSVLEVVGIAPQQLCHIGDNPKSDVAMAKQHGIEAIHYTRTFDSRYEQPAVADLLHSKVIAVSRITRLMNPYHDTQRSVIWDTTSGVSAPLLFFFVAWTIKRAARKGTKRLYFLARDGQIMHKMAQKIIARHYRGKIEARYLYVSRQSLLFPAMEALDEEAFSWIMAPTARLTPEIILKRVNVKPYEIYHLLSAYGFADKTDKHLDTAERTRFRAMLGEAEAFLCARAKAFRRNTWGYLRQEGIGDGTPAGVVDIGWGGTLQRSINRLLDLGGSPQCVSGFYFGLKRRKTYRDYDELEAWFTDHTAPCDLDKKTYIVPMTELFAAADHGGVQKHQSENGRYQPVLHSPRNEAALAWGVDVQQAAMLAYAENALFLSKDDIEAATEACKKQFEENYAKFILHPTANEAAVYGSYPDAEDQNESYRFPLAEAYTEAELVLRKSEGFKHHHNEWVPGAMRLTKEALNRMNDTDREQSR